VTDDVELDELATEGFDPALLDLDLLSTSELVRLAAAHDAAAAAVVAGAAPQVAVVVDAVADRLLRGGRLRYVGAGSAGRLAALDAAELPGTFGIAPDLVRAVVAGGASGDLRQGAEDDAATGAADLRAAGLAAGDAVVGISASGRTPYVLAALDAATQVGALTVGIACTTGSPLAARADLAVELATGAELVAGSTRLKAGTAQKMVLGQLSTLVMVRLGRTYGNLMLDVRADNEKLRRRQVRAVALASSSSVADAEQMLAATDGDARAAVVALAAGVDVPTARARLAAAGGRVRDAIDGET
jgi:N-acetylmuramic acid 6-phosphate etherase